jgi:hypothetical protein
VLKLLILRALRARKINSFSTTVRTNEKLEWSSLP